MPIDVVSVDIPVTVSVGGETCDVTVSSASQIICTLSDVDAGAQDIVVTSQPGGAVTSATAFTYLFAATSVMPASGRRMRMSRQKSISNTIYIILIGNTISNTMLKR